MDAQVAAGLAAGVSIAPDYAQQVEERQIRVAAARSQQQMADIQLQEYQQNAPIRQSVEQLKFQQYEAQVRDMQSKFARQSVYDAFKLYDGDGNPGHLNNALQLLKNNPVAQSWTGGVVRFDQVTDADAKLLQQAGISDVQGFLAHPELRKDIAVATGIDGSKTLINMSQLKAGMGYTQYMEDEELDRMAKRALMMKRLQSGSTVDKESASERVVRQLMEEDPTLTYAQAWAKYKNPNPKSGTTALERTAEKLRQDNPELSYEDSLTQAATVSSPTGKQKDMQAAEEAKTALDSLYGGDFLSADLSNAANRAKAEPYVRRIEQFSGAEMNATQKKRVAEIRQLITLGKESSELTSAEAGPLDSLLRDTRKYISDNVEGTAATSAYEAYRNLARHALMGASLTPSEQAAFERAFGSLKEQQGPVLVKMRTQLQALQDELGAIYDSGDSYVMKYRLGMDEDKLISVLNALDQRLEMFDKRAPADAPEVMVPTKTAPLSKEEQLKRARELLK